MSECYAVAEQQVRKAFTLSPHRNIEGNEVSIRTSDMSDAPNARV